MKLTQCLGDTPHNRILCYLLERMPDDFSITQISMASRTSFNTAKKAIHELENGKFIRKTRNVGTSKMFTYNLRSNQAVLFRKLVKTMEV